MNNEESKKNTNSSKKNLIKTQSEIIRNRTIITVVVLAVLALVYVFIDSKSYVATVNGHRISKAEYQFFLVQQMQATENEEGLATQEDKDAFWSTPADGQDPYETAKREALNYSKELTVQFIMAQESGFKVTTKIKENAASRVAYISENLTNKQFEEQYNISPKDYQILYEKITVIDEFKNQFIDKDFTVPEFSEQEIKAFYDEYKLGYDIVDLSYITLYRFNDAGELRTDAEIAQKIKTAQEALKRAQEGEDMAKLVSEYTEEDAAEAGTNSSRQVGRASISYSEDTIYEYFMDWSLIQWAFDNKIGDIDIVDTNYFIYVAKIEDRTDLADVRSNVEGSMAINAGEEFYAAAIKNWGLETRYNLIKNDRVYDSISYK